ncbi:MAG: trypsin-like serine peptidase [Phycisphaerales bacterium]
MRSYRSFGCFAAVTAGCTLAGAVAAQTAVPPYRVIYVEDASGVHDNATTEWVLAYDQTFDGGAAPWIRLEFGEGNLGNNSRIILTGSVDGQSQTLDPEMFEHWSAGSAIFRGGSIQVQLLVSPGDTGVFIDFHSLLVGETVIQDDPETICGSLDDRALSSDGRVGRLFFGGCTAWLASNGAVLTAGHCVDFDPDRGGPLLPDGIPDISGVVEFNVPASNSNGTTNPADIEDQYPIDFVYLAWRFDGEGQGLGKDWGVFSVGPNSETGLRAHRVQGFFRTTRESPANNTTLRITGCGSDTGTRNFVQQTHTGPYTGESSSGSNFWHQYRVDTTGGNSGSPVIWNSFNIAMGIHTNGGCTSSGGANSGTSFEVDQLETFFHRFQGTTVEYVDRGMPVIGAATPDGQIYRPWLTVVTGVNAVPNNGVVSIVQGSYNETMTITRPMTLIAPVGDVVIGR